VGNLWAALARCARIAPSLRHGPWVVHTAPWGSGRSAGKRTRPHLHRPTLTLWQTHWFRAPGGRLRRWIMLRCVDWLPP